MAEVLSGVLVGTIARMPVLLVVVDCPPCLCY
jgi:hypothetical protein